MSLIPDYANAVGSAMSYNRKAADTKGKEKTDGNALSEKTGKANKADKTDRTGKTGTVTGRTIGNPKLSEKAAKYYEELKRKYSNMDFILVSEDQKEKARAQAGSYANASKMVVLIDEDKIERMAEDENYRRQYEAIIANAGSGIAQMKSSLEASGTKVKGYGMQVNDGGTATYFAVLQKSSGAQKERIEKKREKAAEEKKACLLYTSDVIPVFLVGFLVCLAHADQLVSHFLRDIFLNLLDESVILQSGAGDIERKIRTIDHTL